MKWSCNALCLVVVWKRTKIEKTVTIAVTGESNASAEY